MTVGEIALTANPWISGTRAAGWYGPVEVKQPVAGRCWEDAIDSVLEEAAAQARALGPNAVLNVEINVSPFAQRNGEPCPTIELKGTAAKLEPLFAGFEVAL